MVAGWAVLVVGGGVGTLVLDEPADGSGRWAWVPWTPTARPGGGDPERSSGHCPPVSTTPTPLIPPTATPTAIPSVRRSVVCVESARRE